jgi:hypothetical protein
VQAVDGVGPILHRVAALADEVAQGALRSLRDEAAAQQAVAEQSGDPLRILDAGLMPGHIPDVLGVDHQQLEATFEQVVDRLPEFAGALHDHGAHTEGLEPVAEG